MFLYSGMRGFKKTLLNSKKENTRGADLSLNLSCLGFKSKKYKLTVAGKSRPLVLFSAVILVALIVNILTSNATSSVYTIDSKEDWDGGQLSNLTTSSSPGDIELSPTGYFTARS